MAKMFIWISPYDVTEKLKWNFWPTEYMYPFSPKFPSMD